MLPISDRPHAGDNDFQGGQARRGSIKVVPKVSSGERLVTKRRINTVIIPSLTAVSKKRVRVLKKNLGHGPPTYTSEITSNEDSQPTPPRSHLMKILNLHLQVH